MKHYSYIKSFTLLLLIFFSVSFSFGQQTDDRIAKACVAIEEAVQKGDNFVINMFGFIEACDDQPATKKRSGDGTAELNQVLSKLNERGLSSYVLIARPDENKSPTFADEVYNCVSGKGLDVDILYVVDLNTGTADFQTPFEEAYHFNTSTCLMDDPDIDLPNYIDDLNDDEPVTLLNMCVKPTLFFAHIFNSMFGDFDDIYINRVLNKIRCAYVNNKPVDIYQDNWCMSPNDTWYKDLSMTILDNVDPLYISVHIYNYQGDAVTFNPQNDFYNTFTTRDHIRDKDLKCFVYQDQESKSVTICTEPDDFDRLETYMKPTSQVLSSQSSDLKANFDNLPADEKLKALEQFSKCDLAQLNIIERKAFIDAILQFGIPERQEDLLIDIIASTPEKTDQVSELISFLEESDRLNEIYSEIEDIGGRDNETRISREFFNLYFKFDNNTLANNFLQTKDANNGYTYIYYGDVLILPEAPVIYGIGNGSQELIYYTAHYSTGITDNKVWFSATKLQTDIAGNNLHTVLWEEKFFDPFDEVIVIFNEALPGVPAQLEPIRMPAIYLYELIKNKNFADGIEAAETALTIAGLTCGIGEIVAAKNALQLSMGILDVAITTSDLIVTANLCDPPQTGYQNFCENWRIYTNVAGFTIVGGSLADNLLDNGTISAVSLDTYHSYNMTKYDNISNEIVVNYPVIHNMQSQHYNPTLSNLKLDFYSRMDGLYHIEGAEFIMIRHIEESGLTIVRYPNYDNGRDIVEAIKHDLFLDDELWQAFCFNPNLTKAWTF